MKIICPLLLYLSIYIQVFQNAEGAKVRHKHKQEDEELFSAKVIVHGNPRLHDDLVIHVTTEAEFHNVTVTRIRDSVLHHDVEGFVISGDKDGSTVFDMHKTPDHVHDHASHFFGDVGSGTIVSVVHGDKGSLHVEGILNDIYVIAPPGSERRHRRALKTDNHTLYKQEPMKQGVVDSLEVPKMFLDKSLWVGSYSKRHASQPWPFGVFNQYPASNPYPGTYRHSRSVNGKADERPLSRSRRQSPREPATVEVLVIIDKAMFKNFNYSMTELGLFLLHYWQAVNFKFRTLKDPEIRLKVRQYGAFQFGQYQPFIEQNRIRNEEKKISLYDTLKSFRDWMKKYESNKNFVRHDIAVLQTGEDLCEKTKSGECLKLTSGIGFVGGACITARTFPDYTYDVALSEIGKSFKGVLVMVHEIGHLLGSHHDGEGNSKACSSKSGYVMSYQRDHAFNFSRFSDCSKASIKRFLRNTWYSQCLRETDTDGYEYPHSLPGQYMTIDDQCQNYVRGKPCPERVYPLSERCERLCCEANGYRIKRREPAVDGTDCGGGKVCFNGECLPRNEINS